MVHSTNNQPHSRMLVSILLAVLLHLSLIGLLIFGFSWKSEPESPLAVELWAALPSPPTEETTKPAVVPPQGPPPSTPPLTPAGDIALNIPPKTVPKDIKPPAPKPTPLTEKPKPEEPTKKPVEVEDKTLAKKQAEEAKKQAQAIQAQAIQAQKLKEAMRADVANLNPTDDGRIEGTANVNQAGGNGDSEYSAKIIACILPNVSFPSNHPGNPMVSYNVFLNSKGQQSKAPALIQSSGIDAFDRAVAVGISKCNPFPKPRSGNYPPTITIQYNLQNNR